MNQAPVDQAAVPSTPEKPALWRRIVVPLCVVLGCILTALSVAATWVKLTALDTDTYVATVAPLIKDEDVSLAVATRVTDKVFAEVDVAKIVDEVLPDRAERLGAGVGRRRRALRRPVRSTASSSPIGSRRSGPRPTASPTHRSSDC